MSGSCKKADRNRKSNANAAYKASKRTEINRDKRAKRVQKEAARKNTRMIERDVRNKPTRGAARRKRREGIQRKAA